MEPIRIAILGVEIVLALYIKVYTIIEENPIYLV